MWPGTFTFSFCSLCIDADSKSGDKYNAAGHCMIVKNELEIMWKEGVVLVGRDWGNAKNSGWSVFQQIWCEHFRLEVRSVSVWANLHGNFTFSWCTLVLKYRYIGWVVYSQFVFSPKFSLISWYMSCPSHTRNTRRGVKVMNASMWLFYFPLITCFCLFLSLCILLCISNLCSYARSIVRLCLLNGTLIENEL
jgi:hypothetical protein